MSNTKFNGEYVFTEKVRLAFGNLITPSAYGRPGQKKGDPKYNATIIIPPGHPDLEPLKALAAMAAREMWPGVAFNTLKWPFKNGEERAKKAEEKGRDPALFRGMVVMDLKSKDQPALIVREKGQDRELAGQQREIVGKQKFYNGCFVVPIINLAAYENPEKNGVTAYLNALFFAEDGPRIGRSYVDKFKGFAGSVSTESVSAGMDDEIPF